MDIFHSSCGCVAIFLLVKYYFTHPNMEIFPILIDALGAFIFPPFKTGQGGGGGGVLGKEEKPGASLSITCIVIKA